MENDGLPWDPFLFLVIRKRNIENDSYDYTVHVNTHFIFHRLRMCRWILNEINHLPFPTIHFYAFTKSPAGLPDLLSTPKIDLV